MYGLQDKNAPQPLASSPPATFAQSIPLNYISPDFIDRRNGEQPTMADKLRDMSVKARDIGSTMWRQIQHPSELQ